MYNLDTMDKRYVTFGYIFLLSNRLQTIMDRHTRGLTSKQWFVITMLGMFDTPPTLVQLAKMCDTSHQNTKQIVIKLNEKGFVNIEKDPNDRRAMRIVATEKCTEWHLENEAYTRQFIDKMYDGLAEGDTDQLFKSQQKIYDNLEKLEKSDL